MKIKNTLALDPKFIQDFPAVQSIVQFMENQAEQIQNQSEQIQKQVEEICKLKNIIDKLKDEISRLNKTPKRPKFGKNNMEPRNRGNGSSQNSTRNNKSICIPEKKQEEIKIAARKVPEGSRFKGYTKFKVQDVKINVKETIYKLEVWQSPNGKIIRAKLPKELRGKHFGSELRTLIINFYAQGMTEPTIKDFLQGVGVYISSGQINNILLEEADQFTKVSEEILEAGLNEASYIRTDDTGARHKHKNGYCTHIGGEYFAYYKTTFSKSRRNFLEILLQGKEGYRVNDAMIWHLYQSGLPDNILNLFEENKGKKYHTEKSFKSFLTKINLHGKKLLARCLEAALIGYISEEILKKDQILLSDRAGQFAVFNHSACWVHMERPLRKITASSELVQKELEQVREAIWELYRKLKKSALTQTGKEEVERQYDALVSMKSISPAIMLVIENFREYRDEMLKALDYPGLPLHNNDSERDIRSFVKRRKISGSTKSEKGKEFRDGLASLKQTCFRLGISFWKYSSDWFKGHPPDLAQIVRDCYQSHSPYNALTMTF